MPRRPARGFIIVSNLIAVLLYVAHNLSHARLRMVCFLPFHDHGSIYYALIIFEFFSHIYWQVPSRVHASVQGTLPLTAGAYAVTLHQPVNGDSLHLKRFTPTRTTSPAAYVIELLQGMTGVGVVVVTVVCIVQV